MADNTLEEKTKAEIESFMDGLEKRNPGETEFHQAVQEVAEDVMPLILSTPVYQKAQILERMTEPDRVIIFRVSWMDDEKNFRVNRGYRVQFNNSIGAYKGGIRFHPSVSLSILKFLGFEQTLKNSLTTLPMGGAKGGANFNPKGKSDEEVMRFCQSFVTELQKHIGPDMDVPAGDIGVGHREIGYLFGQYKRLQNEFTGAFTGKGISFGGSLIRTEATGYGCVYFVENMLKHIGNSIEGKKCVISGSGNVAQYTAEKIIQLGGKVLTLSDSSGFIFDPEGITKEKLAWVMDHKRKSKARISKYAEKFKCEYHADQRPWNIPCDIAFPSATQNELDLADAKTLVKNGLIAVGEGANMPSTNEAVRHFRSSKILFAPAKAANAGGVSVSGLEQSQNALRLSWTRNEVDNKLQEIMSGIHGKCVEYGKENDFIDYAKGANVAGFIKVADAMVAYGVV